MINLRTVFVLSTVVASAYGHTRGVNRSPLEVESIESEERESPTARRLMKSEKPKKLTLTADQFPSTITSPIDSFMQQNTKKQKDSGGKSDSSTTAGLAEEHVCVPFNDDMKARASLSLSDNECKTNECGGGCCRVYHWLICDTNNEMPQLSCVCNENTKTPPTEAPTKAPTETPTKAPADSTSDVKDSAGLNNPSDTATVPDVSKSPTTSSPQANPQTPIDNGSFTGGAPADACSNGSPHHNNPLFREFTKCFDASDCPLATECCIHSFCFCGEPDDWTGDCVAPVSDTGK